MLPTVLNKNIADYAPNIIYYYCRNSYKIIWYGLSINPAYIFLLEKNFDKIQGNVLFFTYKKY
jgi:hypothetical protein